jgi:hypothetical protein
MFCPVAWLLTVTPLKVQNDRICIYLLHRLCYISMLYVHIHEAVVYLVVMDYHLYFYVLGTVSLLKLSPEKQVSCHYLLCFVRMHVIFGYHW